MKIQKVCKCCSKEVVIDISREAYDNWKNGLHLIVAAPHLTADEREIMISGICGECFDNAFKED